VVDVSSVSPNNTLGSAESVSATACWCVSACSPCLCIPQCKVGCSTYFILWELEQQIELRCCCLSAMKLTEKSAKNEIMELFRGLSLNAHQERNYHLSVLDQRNFKFVTEKSHKILFTFFIAKRGGK
jgi:hypothetical protein